MNSITSDVLEQGTDATSHANTQDIMTPQKRLRSDDIGSSISKSIKRDSEQLEYAVKAMSESVLRSNELENRKLDIAEKQLALEEKRHERQMAMEEGKLEVERIKAQNMEAAFAIALKQLNAKDI